MNSPEPTLSTCIYTVRRERDIRQHYFESMEEEERPQRILLDRAELVIGRGADADIRIASQRASRQHAFLTRRGTDYLIRDNDSYNGIFLNGLKIHSAVLRDGDVIQLADCGFVYREG